MPHEPVRAKECRPATCRDSRRRRHRTRDEVVLSAQQRQHGVVDGCQMSPEVKHSIPARCYFPQDLLGREASKQLVRPIDLGLPYFQPESYARGVVSHASISCQPMRNKRLIAAEQTASSINAPIWIGLRWFQT